MATAFRPDDVFNLDDKALDDLPFGVITLDRDANVARYNRYESELARKDKQSVIGTNFFKDVAPCTAVQDFKGRWEAFMQKRGYNAESFDFVFKFAWGSQRVHITFVKKDDSGEVNVLVARADA